MTKVRTLIKVLQTFGLIEVFLIIYRKMCSDVRPKSNYQSHLTPQCDTEITSVFRSIPCEVEEIESARNELKIYLDANLRNPTIRKSFFDSKFDFGEASNEILFLLIRILKPSVVLETGVAAGQSSDTILHALRLNEKGHLFSVDVTNQVGELIQEDNKSRWSLFVLPKFRRRRAFTMFAQRLGSIDFFLHDSDHSDVWQLFELSIVMKCVPPPNILFFDDVSHSLISEIQSVYPSYSVHYILEKSKCAALIVRSARESD